MNEDDLQKLERLREVTEDAKPSAGFDDAIMALVEAETRATSIAPTSDRNGSVLAGVERRGRTFLMIAAIAAGVCLWLSLRAQSSLDDEALATIDTVEVSE